MKHHKTIERLSLYRRLLQNLENDQVENVYSHHLAGMCNVTAAIVRKDLMGVGYLGNPRHGYQVNSLLKCINVYFEGNEANNVILVGIGNLGRALMSYFSKGNSSTTILSAFDLDDSKVNRVICNVKCLPYDEMKTFINSNKIKTAIICVPKVQAQKVADNLVNYGIKGILNFAPTRLLVPDSVFVENADISMFLDKVIYFASK